MSVDDCKTFCKKTTIHAIPDLHDTNGYKEKAFWILILLACTCTAAVEIYRVFDQFEKKPVITTHDYHSLSNITFPKVTVCLPHFINSTKVAEEKIAPSIVNQVIGSGMSTIQLSMMMKAINKDFQTPEGELGPLMFAQNETQALEFAVQLAPFLQAEPEALVAAAANELSKLFPNIFLGNALFKAHFEVIKKYMTPDGYLDMENFLDVFGLQLNETLLLCYFNQFRKCESVGQPVYDIKYQRCFLMEVNETQTVGGFGLSLVINTHSSTLAWPSIPALSHGIVISISNEYIPFSESYSGIPAPAIAQVQLRPTHVVLTKSKKFGKCSNVNECTLISRDIPYSNFGCQGDCLFGKLIAKCGCIMYFPARLLQNSSTVPICRSFKQLMCLTTVKIQDKNCTEKCKTPCTKWQYAPTISYTKFPSPKLGQLLLKKGWGKNMYDIIYLVVSFAEMTYTLISEEDSLTFDGCIGQIGGHLGLFLGASIISIIQLLVYLLPLLFKSAQNKMSNDSGSMKNRTSTMTRAWSSSAFQTSFQPISVKTENRFYSSRSSSV